MKNYQTNLKLVIDAFDELVDELVDRSAYPERPKLKFKFRYIMWVISQFNKQRDLYAPASLNGKKADEYLVLEPFKAFVYPNKLSFTGHEDEIDLIDIDFPADRWSTEFERDKREYIDSLYKKDNEGNRAGLIDKKFSQTVVDLDKIEFEADPTIFYKYQKSIINYLMNGQVTTTSINDVRQDLILTDNIREHLCVEDAKEGKVATSHLTRFPISVKFDILKEDIATRRVKYLMDDFVQKLFSNN